MKQLLRIIKYMNDFRMWPPEGEFWSAILKLCFERFGELGELLQT